MADATIVGADTPLSEEEWNRIPQELRAEWTEGTAYKVDTGPDVTTFTPLKDLTIADGTTVAADTPLSEERRRSAFRLPNRALASCQSRCTSRGTRSPP